MTFSQKRDVRGEVSFLCFGAFKRSNCCQKGSRYDILKITVQTDAAILKDGQCPLIRKRE